jgi:hypothetical protein
MGDSGIAAIRAGKALSTKKADEILIKFSEFPKTGRESYD